MSPEFATLGNNIYHISENGEVFITLIVGEEILGYEVYSSTCAYKSEVTRVFYSKSKL